MSLDWPTFVLQRRINLPYPDVRGALLDPAVLAAGTTLALGTDGLGVIAAPFRTAPFPSENALRAPAVLSSNRGRRIALVRFEVTAWSDDATALTVQPLTAHPDRWNPRRMNLYFALAHHAADVVVRIVAERVTVS